MAWYQTRNYPNNGIYPQYNTHLRYFTATPPIDAGTGSSTQDKKKNITARGKKTKSPPSTSSNSSSTKTKDLKPSEKSKGKNPVKRKVKFKDPLVDQSVKKPSPKKIKKEPVTNQNNFI